MSNWQIRKLSSKSEFSACVDMQREVWGPELDEIVGEADLSESVDEGGILLGALDPSGHLAGFVFSYRVDLPNCRIQHSHMLAVPKALRNQGIGSALKWAQREEAARLEADLIVWTFDPLEARNAFVNLQKLGVTCRHYLVDLYKDSRSPLHTGTPTDRLLAEWPVSAAWARAVPLKEPEADLPVLLKAETGESALPEPRTLALDPLPDRLLVEIPSDFQLLKANDLSLARRWRYSSREAFQRCFMGFDFEVTGFLARQRPRTKSAYALTRSSKEHSIGELLDFTTVPFSPRP